MSPSHLKRPVLSEPEKADVLDWIRSRQHKDNLRYILHVGDGEVERIEAHRDTLLRVIAGSKALPKGQRVKIAYWLYAGYIPFWREQVATLEPQFARTVLRLVESVINQKG